MPDTDPEPTAAQAALWAARAGLPLPPGRRAAAAAAARHIHSVVVVLRELDFADTPPAFAYRAHQEAPDAAV
ncbi:hypothetical protein C0216_16410 [Streptomyces globosus]|uniref:Amidase n=1 Tax=Streptomyces globosus TaxID=68209 RepID=A0A344U1Q0_9ACTN|nr:MULTISPECIES: hypothetical protein [Streptomyces]AXE24821.1 hypothetical protein C0216_16410 [Streptomyces globosus]